MFGRIAKMFLAVALTELLGSAARAGGRWVDRKLGAPLTPAAESVSSTPQATIVTDGDGGVIGVALAGDGGGVNGVRAAAAEALKKDA